MKCVSVIIPAYNAEKYIEECLHSLFNQTYTALEIHVVNDGSSDQTEAIVSELMQQDSRLRLYNNENHGVSYSRNYAIQRSEGEYIAFVDADDIVSADYIETLVSSIEYNNADMSAVGVVKSREFSDGCFTSGENILYDNEEILVQLFGTYEGFLCNKLYRRDLLQRNHVLLNQSISQCEDLLFNIAYLQHCKKAVYNNGKKYFYRQNGVSATYRLNSIKWFDMLYVYSIIIDELVSYPCARKMALNRYSVSLCEARYRLDCLDGEDTELREHVNSEWRRIRPLWKTFSVKQQLKLWLFMICPKAVMNYRRRRL